MPVYDTTPTPQEVQVLTAGRPITLWNAEGAAAGTASLQFALHRDPHFPHVCSVEIQFAADPGAFQIDFQTADTDLDSSYCTKGSLSSGLNSSFVGRIEVTNVVAKFIRLKMVAKTNAVNVTAKVY